MLQKIFIFLAIIIAYIIWYVILLLKGRNTSHLFFSFVVTCIPFQISIPIFTPQYVSPDGIGSFTAKIFIMIPLMVSGILLLTKKHKHVFYLYQNERWVLWILGLVLISFLNPFNVARWGTTAFLVAFVSYIFYFRLIYNSLTPVQVLNGIFSSFLFLCTLNFLLALCYPVLGISFVTTLFQAGGDMWATRNGTRAGAIGIFVTPANLGLFSVLASGFFFSCWLSDFKKQKALLALAIAAITIILTYSRTSYVTLVVILFALFYVSKNADKPLVSIKSFFLAVLPAAVVLYWLIFLSPFSATFLKTDADDMYQARLDHYAMGMDLFRISPVIGVGMNSHLEYVNRSVELSKHIHNEFLTSNPIHNTHLIILAETGIIGLAMWVVFILAAVRKARINISQNINTIFSLAQISLLLVYIIYGFTDWAPVSHSTFPIFLLFTFFFNKYSKQVTV